MGDEKDQQPPQPEPKQGDKLPDSSERVPPPVTPGESNIDPVTGTPRKPPPVAPDEDEEREGREEDDDEEP